MTRAAPPVAATSACIGVNPALTISSSSTCSKYPCHRPSPAPVSVPIAIAAPASARIFTFRLACSSACLIDCACLLLRVLSWSAGSHEPRHLRAIVGDVPQEERVLEERRRRFVHEHRQIARQGRDIPDVPALELGGHRRIDILVAHAVREHVDPRLQQPPRVVGVVQMRRRPQSPLMRLIDEGAIHFRRHVTGVAVDVHLDGVNLQVGVTIRSLPRFLGRFRVSHAWRRDIDPGAIQRHSAPARRAAVSHPEGRPATTPARTRW